LLSTGASQFDLFSELVKKDVDWGRVEMFHLDEYLGMSSAHPASFVRYLSDRFLAHLPPLKAVHFVDGTRRASEVIEELTGEINKAPIDIGLIGIGENGHIAFNDPPADFETEKSYIVVTLDEKCRRQQMGEGWFAIFDDVPKQAISMSVKQIFKCRKIISCVPYSVKARAVKDTLENDVTREVPATILKTHPDWTLFLDADSAALTDYAAR
jgi:glucosamine-6-phosphate deaminase